MFFSDVIGQEAVKARLAAGVREGRVSHAMLFTGPSGSGKLALALAYAQYVNCLQPGEFDSCGNCSSCLKSSKFVHPDLHFIFPVNTSKDVKNASSDIYLPEWREALSESPYQSLNNWYDRMGIENKQGIITAEESQQVLRKLSLVAYEGKFRIMLIWCAEKMNAPAANKLLKILEEPPPGTLFLLTTTNAEDLLPTIVSRTQNLHLAPLSDLEIEKELQKEFELDQSKAASFARLAAGNYTQAREFVMGADSGEDFTALFVEWSRVAWTLTKFPSQLVKWVDQIAALGREQQKAFLLYALHMVRESLIIHYGDKRLDRMTMEENEFMIKFHKYIDGRNGPALVDLFNKAHYHIERNANPRILFLDLSLNLSALLKANS